MERPSGKLCIERRTHNSIYVKWILSKVHQDANHSSPSFVLINEGYAIPFYLNFKASPGVITVEQTTGEIGRAIITVAVNAGNNMNDIRVKLTKKWKDMCTFKNFGQSKQSLDESLDEFLDEYSDHMLILAECPSLLPVIDKYPLIPRKQRLDKNPPQPIASNATIFCKIIWLGFASDVILPDSPLSPLSIANAPFDNTENPDFTLIVENQEIPVHKTILARYSSVFSTMFQTPMIESKNNEVVIEDVEFLAMEVIVDIIYRGETAKLDDFDTALEVLMAAEKYEMSMIKTICECKLQLKITTNNVLELLQEADKYNAVNLCETCVAYIFAVQDPEILWEFGGISQTHNIAFAVMNVMKPYGSELIPTEKM